MAKQKTYYKPRPVDPTHFRSLFEVMEYFKEEETCRKYLIEIGTIAFNNIKYY